MSRMDQNQLRAALQPLLRPGERIDHVAYGISPPNILIVIPLFVLAILPGVIAYGFLTKHCIVGVTQGRLLISEFKGNFGGATFDVTNMRNSSTFDIAEIPKDMVSWKSGALFTFLRLKFMEPKLTLKFHRMYSKTNRPEAEAIGTRVMSQV